MEIDHFKKKRQREIVRGKQSECSDLLCCWRKGDQAKKKKKREGEREREKTSGKESDKIMF